MYKKGKNMKKLISICTVACMMFSLFVFSTSAGSTDAVAIATWEELVAKVDENVETNFVLTADVTVGAGQSIPYFYGHLDGAGHTVTVEDTMFDQLCGDSYLHDFTIQSKDNAVVNFTPFVMLINDLADAPAVFVNITNNVSIDLVSDTTGDKDCAGFVAKIEGDGAVFMYNCVNNGNIKNSNQAGGFVARTWPSDCNITLINCINNGDIYSAVHHAGAFLGCMDSSNSAHNIVLQNCANYGNVSSTLNSCGGLIGLVNGYMSTVKIDNCYTEGKLSLSSSDTNENCNTSGFISFIAAADSIDITNSLVNISEYNPSSKNASYFINYCSASATVTIKNCYYLDVALGDLQTGSYDLQADGSVLGGKAVTEAELSGGETLAGLGSGWVQNFGVDSHPVPAALTDVKVPIPEITPVVTEAPAADTTEAPAADTTKAPAADTTEAPAGVTTEAPADDSGCKSVASAGIAVIAILGTAVVFKKD